MVTEQEEICVATAQESDRIYSGQERVQLIDRAIRVEQGEYGIADTKGSIGTHNVQQCVVLHIKNETAGLHGLAHVDGHTEIRSLESFLEDLQIGKDTDMKGVQLQIIGANSEMQSGLNSSDGNLKKVREFLTAYSFEDVDTLIMNRDVEHKNFVIDDSGEIHK